jgi:mRNA-degrading endonuclease YafQ of YafQ-DinJ toxin-antitoxin module
MLSKYIKNNPALLKRFQLAFEKLIDDQFSPTLRTHKVISKSFGTVYSSRVTGDIRIIWNYHQDQIVILVYMVGSHSGKKAVY